MVVNGFDEFGVCGVLVYLCGDVGIGWVLYVEGVLCVGLVELIVDLVMWLLVGVVLVEVVDGY